MYLNICIYIYVCIEVHKNHKNECNAAGGGMLVPSLGHHWTFVVNLLRMSTGSCIHHVLRSTVIYSTT
jgi:hypothetical protein